MPLVVLDCKLQNPLRFPRSEWTAINRNGMRAAGELWRDKMLDRHFTSGNTSRYRFDKRNAFYKNVVKREEGEGEGKTVMLTLKGKSRRWLKSFARIVPTANKVTVHMHGPAYFANPKVGKVEKTITTKQGGQKEITINIRQQPNKVAELLQVNEQDRRELEFRFFDEVRAGVKKLIG